jgi:hypothetical protein
VLIAEPIPDDEHKCTPISARPPCNLNDIHSIETRPYLECLVSDLH